MSSYEEGLVHQLVDALEKAGYTKRDVTCLRWFFDHSLILGVLRGTHEIVVKHLLSCRVTVDCSLSPEQALAATGHKQHKQYVDQAVVGTMPRGDRDQEEVFFFHLGRRISDDELEEEYAIRGLVPCDPCTLAKVNQDDPAFRDAHPNGTHWKDDSDKWCFIALDGWYGERYVRVGRNDDDWHDRWWFAGVRK